MIVWVDSIGSPICTGRLYVDGYPVYDLGGGLIQIGGHGTQPFATRWFTRTRELTHTGPSVSKDHTITEPAATHTKDIQADKTVTRVTRPHVTVTSYRTNTKYFTATKPVGERTVTDYHVFTATKPRTTTRVACTVTISTKTKYLQLTVTAPTTGTRDVTKDKTLTTTRYFTGTLPVTKDRTRTKNITCTKYRTVTA